MIEGITALFAAAKIWRGNDRWCCAALSALVGLAFRMWPIS
jgi:hypothetical protein